MGTSHELADRVKEGLSERYRLERELGRGGMATVFLARDLAHDRLVAIKVVHDDVAAGITAERFLREIRLLAALQHPNILPLHDSGVIGGTPYYVMPYVAGESLRDRLIRDRTLPLSLALRITAEAAAALDYAHRQGIVHRDIKPENILLSDEHVIIADFGIARAAAQSADDRLTATSVVIGTPAYMSPEQASGEIGLDGRSDVYSLACVLFEMLTGQRPFTGSTTLGVVASRFSKPAPPASSLREGVPKPGRRSSCVGACDFTGRQAGIGGRVRRDVDRRRRSASPTASIAVAPTDRRHCRGSRRCGCRVPTPARYGLTAAGRRASRLRWPFFLLKAADRRETSTSPAE